MEAYLISIFALIGWQLGYATCDEAVREEYVAHIQHIRSKLFDASRYDSSQRTVNNGSEITNVTVDIVDVSYVNWHDDGLVWDKEDHGGVEYIIVSQSEAWFPDITPINANSNDYVLARDTAYLDHNGSLWDCHPARIKVPCVMDLTDYPHDRHLCSVRFSSSTYLESEVRTVGFRFYLPAELSSEWDAKALEPSHGVALNRSYADMVIEMRRRASHRLYTVTLPWVAAVLLMLLGFWMSVDSDRRLWLACVNLFLLAVMLGRMGMLLDRSATVPKIVFFLGNAMVIQAMVAFLAIFILNMASTPVKIPERLVQFLTGPTGGLLCLNQDCLWTNQPQPRSEDEVFPRTRVEGGNKRGWLLLAQALDRLFFGVIAIVALGLMPW
ncbi:hypothetical protein HPB47_000252 [Ixodes persulcatus]|uniref:Uncharacterized protein n=1 Tax=Ixodes persulcatus TaxID=34615 RepID=A0AC60PSD1_IXOPE|nr:hypothetical protein HPB47_000252 [Ixodes persulcatus]